MADEDLQGIVLTAPSAGDPQVSGNAEALESLAAAVEQRGLFRIAGSRPGRLEAVEVVETTESACISVEGPLLRLSGSPKALAALAGNVRFVAAGPSQEPSPVPYHLHIEPHPGNENWLAADSTPLVVQLDA